MASDTFGEWLRRRRRQLGLTQQQMADCASCSIVTIRKFEADERRPSRQLAELLAGCLEIPAAEQEAFVAFARAADAAPTPAVGSISLPQFGQPKLPTTPAESGPPILNLPAALTSLIGRQEEVAAISRSLLQPETRLLTLTGPGGTGKTRLALEVAHHLWQEQPDLWRDGVCFVDLSAVTDTSLLIPAIAGALGLKESSERTLRDSLVAFLQNKRLLLVLDNFEQLVEAGRELVYLLSAAAGLKLLVTSRILLRVYGEYEYPVLPLPLPRLDADTNLLNYAAITLFIERSRAARPDFQLTLENGAAVAELCARLDGLPLAIELAAARSKLLSPATLLAQLGNTLQLASPQRHASQRQRTLGNTIEWSYRLLGPAEQRLFARLGIFAGDFTLEAAENIIGDWSVESNSLSTLQSPIFDGLISLVDHSMVQQLPDEDGLPRFRLLRTLRDYALVQLALSGELETAQSRHAHYYLALAEAAQHHYNGPAVITWLQRLDAAHDNLRAVLNWATGNTADPGRRDIALRLIVALAEYWHMRGHLGEWHHWSEQALAISRNAPPELRAAVLDTAGLLAIVMQNYAQAESLLRQALNLWHYIEEPAGVARGLRHLGLIYWHLENYAVAQGYSQQALALERELGNDTRAGIILNDLGNIANYQGDGATAELYFSESLAIARRVGNKHNTAAALGNLGNVAQVQGNYQQARTYFEESLALLREMGFIERAANVLGNLGNTGLNTDDLAAAQACFQECLDIRTQLGQRLATGHALHGLGIVADRRGQPQAALAYLAESLQVQQAAGQVRGLPALIETIARIAGRHGRPYEAAQLFGAMEVVREQKTISNRTPHGRAFYEQALADLHARLPADTLETAWQSGRQLALPAAIDLAYHLAQLTAGATAAMPAASPAPAYVEESLLAIGGMGEVYRGRDASSGQPVVIKRLRPELIAQNSEIVTRFVREGELLRQLRHPNIVQMLSAVQQDSYYLIVMEYVPGGSLRDLLNRQHQLPLHQIVEIGLELADALARAHHLNVIHRDLKPENVLLAADGTPRLTDFGIAYQPHIDTRLTPPGVLLGTMAYLSPEGYLGQELDARSDIWSFGVILYEMLAGQNPFAGGSLGATMMLILNQAIPDLSQVRPDTPPLFTHLLGRMLVKEREQRLNSARQVAAELERIATLLPS
jgi:predicted ATPase/transcriptional regulator with XRE-family HTH domain